MCQNVHRNWTKIIVTAVLNVQVSWTSTVLNCMQSGSPYSVRVCLKIHRSRVREPLLCIQCRQYGPWLPYYGEHGKQLLVLVSMKAGPTSWLTVNCSSALLRSLASVFRSQEPQPADEESCSHFKALSFIGFDALSLYFWNYLEDILHCEPPSTD